MIENIKYAIKREWDIIKSWFSYYKVLRNCYDFDYSSILSVEKHQIKRVQASIAKYKHHLNYKRDLQNIDRALRLLAASEEDILEMNPLTGKYETIRKVNARNASRFTNITPIDSAFKLCHLYKCKAWYLYHKMRYEHLKEWWD